MRVVDLIRQKREGRELTLEQINFLIQGYTRGEIPDYQISALLMAILWRGMTHSEIASLTDAMLRSGSILDLSDLPGRKVDKHSTGGIGDKTSLVIAPIAAAGGLVVPMISGRGLGHTGGTLDKLESIPGFNVNLSLADFRRVLGKCGCALIGATDEIAPADKKIYALRDVTATVESPALICASIMSKKLAEDIDALVLDVKTGSGAFLKSEKDAVGLADLMVETGKRMGKRVVALVTDMDQPLGRAAGNAMEVAESIDILNGQGPADLRDLCLELSAWMFYVGDRVSSVDEGKQLAANQIASGRAKEKFREIIRLQGGDDSVVDHPDRLPRAQHRLDVASPANGYVEVTDCEKLGLACVALGAGRNTKEDTIDPAVGLIFHRKQGDLVRQGDPLSTIHYNSPARLDYARDLVAGSLQIRREAPVAKPLVRRMIGAPGLNR
jgi:pyrimidine-nucleoside phosphorylase